MAYVNTICMDELLNEIATGTTITICSSAPSTFSDIATYRLAATSLTSSDFTIGDGGSSGSRRVTIAAKNNLNIDTSGTATCVVVDDGVDILVISDLEPQQLTSGNQVDIPEWYCEIEAPT